MKIDKINYGHEIIVPGRYLKTQEKQRIKRKILCKYISTMEDIHYVGTNQIKNNSFILFSITVKHIIGVIRRSFVMNIVFKKYRRGLPPSYPPSFIWI